MLLYPHCAILFARHFPFKLRFDLSLFLAEVRTYRRAKAIAAERGLTIKSYTLLLYREDDERERIKKRRS
jgi:hypothetical protein